MKYKVFLAIESMIITIAIMVFAASLFVVLNEGRKRIDGEGISVYLNCDTLVFRNGEKEVTIQPDKEEVGKAINFCYDHPFVLPFPFNLMVISNRMSSLVVD